MNLTMDDKVAENYKSNSQKIRVITEQWVSNNLFCPYCGKEKIAHFENNRPVADFYCPDCAEEYELKSKNGTIENKVNDGAYDTMIKRIEWHHVQSRKRKYICHSVIENTTRMKNWRRNVFMCMKEYGVMRRVGKIQIIHSIGQRVNFAKGVDNICMNILI